jgi:LysR family glycine cleavage system transcriptional activator
MSNRHLPLNSLKVFEAVARHLSVKKASEELCVTPGAVSRQLSQLESLIGAPLFQRTRQGLELMPAARLCLPRLQEGLAALRESVELIYEHTESQPLLVYAAPAFGMRWLMPRLHRFALAHPSIDVQVSTRVSPYVGRRGATQATLGLRAWTDQADVVLIFGDDRLAENAPDLHVERLIPLSITPLCHPRLLERANAMRVPEDVLEQTLLHDHRGLRYGDRSFWQSWLDAAGVSKPGGDVGPRFTHSVLAIEAAIEGVGIVATTPVLALDALRSGALVAPFDLEVALDSAYYLVSKPATYERADVTLFRRWLRAEAQLEVSRLPLGETM